MKSLLNIVPLTNRETEVLQFMKQGWLSKEIADTLNVSINTINTHRPIY